MVIIIIIILFILLSGTQFLLFYVIHLLNRFLIIMTSKMPITDIRDTIYHDNNKF